MRPGTACASAPRHTSATRWLTSTLPAPTAAGGAAFDERAGRRDHGDRAQRAAVGRERRIGRRPHRERDRADGHRLDRVDVARPLGIGAGEVERDLVARDGDRDGDRRRRPAGRGADRSCRARPRSATCRRAARAAPPGRAARRSRAPRRTARRRARPVGPRPTALAPTWASRSPAPLVGRARVGQQRAPAPRRSAASAGCAGPPRRSRWRRPASSRARCRPHRRGGPGSRPTRPAAVRRRPTKHGATTVTSLRWVPPANGSLRTTCSPGPRRSASGAPARAVDRRPDRRRHRSEVHRDVLGLGEQLAVGGEERRRAVGPLLDVRAERGPPQHRAHLVGHAGQARDQDLQRRRIEAHRPAPGAAPARRPRRARPASPRAPRRCSRARRRPPGRSAGARSTGAGRRA